ncbi:MAG: PQQ-binding-like beta-propeller repeat protein, partial [Planctomycetia bacterium]|nr:PQQ-binding-like beta-propeller repeat protein [Planctomycetia bacterium]
MRTLIAFCMTCVCVVSLSAADPPARLDPYGDPLPTGALMRLGTLRNRAPITSFGIQKDGTVVTAGPGGIVLRWNDVDDTPETRIVLPAPGPREDHPQVSPDGKFIATRSANVHVWSVANEKPKEIAKFTIEGAQLCRFSPDGSKLAVVAWVEQISTVHLCDIKTGKVTKLEGVASDFAGPNFSGDGKRLAAISTTELHLWNTATGEQLANHLFKGNMFTPFALNHAGDLLVQCTRTVEDKVAWRFTDPLTGKNRDGLSGPEDNSIDLTGSTWLTFAPDGKTLLHGDPSGVRWWDPTTGKMIRKFEGFAEGYDYKRHTPGRFTPDGKTLVAYNESILLRWDAKTGKPLFAGQDVGHRDNVNGVGVSPDGKKFATHGHDSRLCMWDATTGKQLWHAPAAWLSYPSHLNFSPDGKFIYTTGPKGDQASKLDATTGKPVLTFTLDPKESPDPIVERVRLSANGKTLFGVIGMDPQFVLWDAETGKWLKTDKLPNLFRGAEISPDCN